MPGKQGRGRCSRLGYYISYLAYDPDDAGAWKTHREIKRRLSEKNLP
jgi:hypothetical protein